MNSITFVIKICRKIYRLLHNSPLRGMTFEYCQFRGQEGNDEILRQLKNYKKGGLMLSKWGTVELSQAVYTYLVDHHTSPFKMFFDTIMDKYSIIDDERFSSLANQAGVFPKNREVTMKFGHQVLNDCQQIDIVASYMKIEKVLMPIMKSTKVDLDAFYAPWKWNNPWTSWLLEKKVLIIHPFVESIKYQYEHNRMNLFSNKDVLPKFASIAYIKAVQSQGDEHTQFKDWFEALKYMEAEIAKKDFDVAIIGCGAYGMSLAAYVKSIGKVAIHLAGWTQMLFGVYGERWISQQTQYSSVINQYWIRPNKKEGITNQKSIENGCYW